MSKEPLFAISGYAYQHLTRLHELSCEENLVEDGVYLVEVEDKIEFAHVAKVLVEDLDKEMDGLEVGELVILTVHANAEEETFAGM